MAVVPRGRVRARSPGAGRRARAHATRAAAPSASVRESRWMPTRTCGTPWRSAASAEANSSVSRTTTSGRHASTIASMRGSAARACRPMNSSWTTWAMPGEVARRPDRRPRPLGVLARRLADGGEREPGAPHERRGRSGPRDEDLVAGGGGGARERDQGADVAGPARGGEEEAHGTGGRRPASAIPTPVRGWSGGDDWAPAGPTVGIERAGSTGWSAFAGHRPVKSLQLPGWSAFARHSGVKSLHPRPGDPHSPTQPPLTLAGARRPRDGSYSRAAACSSTIRRCTGVSGGDSPRSSAAAAWSSVSPVPVSSRADQRRNVRPAHPGVAAIGHAPEASGGGGGRTGARSDPRAPRRTGRSR